jgi:hypothetical protein
MVRSRVAFLLALTAAAAVTAVAVPASASTTPTSPVPAAIQGAHGLPPDVTVRIGKLSSDTRGSITPLSDSGCVGNLPWNNVQTCISINGGGLHVNYMAADSNVYNYAIVEYVQLIGPSINTETATYVIDAGDYLDLVWSPNANVKAGSYCAISWELNGSGGYTNDGEACQPVSA